MKDYEKDPAYRVYIEVVNAASGDFDLATVYIAMREYARAPYTMATPKSMSRAIVAQDDAMLLLAVHRWRNASANFSQEDHNASLEWRAQHDPVYIEEQSRKHKLQGDK